ncbi:hypothetical protein PENTCL1PPCAC_699, partial [Pristionchus entomophagus]
ASILSVHQSRNGTISVCTWSRETRKLTQITISSDLVIEAVGKQLLRAEVGSMIAAGEGALLARSCDQDSSCKTLFRGTKDKWFRCVGASSERLPTLGVVELPALKAGHSTHKILPRSTGDGPEGTHVVLKSATQEESNKTKNSTEIMWGEQWNVYETMNDFVQDSEYSDTIITAQTVIVFLYLLIFTLLMFIRTVEDGGERLTFTTDERAQLHAYDFIAQPEEPKK